MYSLLRRFLFALPPERAHKLALTALTHLPVSRKAIKDSAPVTLMGLSFKNRVGLSAGIDNNGDYLKGLAKLGTGFIELGGVTPRPQPGNPQPRIFRLVNEKAIINRMGFPNRGVKHLLNNIKQSQYQGVLGVNLGKNKDTPIANAVDDYLACMDVLYPHVSYLTINVSSPNTPNLRELQSPEKINALYQTLKDRQKALSDTHGKYTPLVVKLTVDMESEDLKQTVAVLNNLDVDGLVFSNTTVNREAVKQSPHCDEAGGLSGKPLFSSSTAALSFVRQLTDKPIIGVGGIMSDSDGAEKFKAGADLIALYTGFVYGGPQLINQLITNSYLGS